VIFIDVLAPLIAPSIASGALFAFAISFDELIVALFIAGPEQYTLPRQMLAGLREFLSPTICAAAVVLTAVSLLLLSLTGLLRSRET
jgi:putative spermidine/putrescine transport system permease protein